MMFLVKNETVFDDIETERTRKIESLFGDFENVRNEFMKTMSRYGRKDEAVSRALNYAASLDFSHSPLQSDYLSHPLRLATYLLKMIPEVDVDSLVVSVLHNVPEAAAVSLAELQDAFGPRVASGVGTLLVDRKASSTAYTEAYYKKVYQAGPVLTLIKLLDKMDNLLVLCLNPDDKVRRAYIEEVRQKLLPFARGYHPELGAYLERLLSDAEKRGHCEELRKRWEAYKKSSTNGRSSV